MQEETPSGRKKPVIYFVPGLTKANIDAGKRRGGPSLRISVARCFVMRFALFGALLAVGVAGCADHPADSTGWTRYDGTPIKGNAALEEEFQNANEVCQGRNMRVYRDCMTSRGYVEGMPPIAASPTISAPPPAISAVSQDWRARAAEARVIAGQLRDPLAKQMMVGVAEQYDRLATYSERRSTINPKSSTR
jgi:hypothetical protein